MTRGRVAGPRGRDERGFALLVVLLVMALVAVVGAEFAYSMRLEASAVRAYKNGIIGGHLAETALEQAIREIVADAPYVVEEEDGLLTFYAADRRAVPRLKRAKAELGGGFYSYRIADEEARLNVNTAPPDRVDRLLTTLGVEKENRDTIVDSIQDWRDPNGEHRVNGAESDDYYLKLPIPYRARNANLESITELLQIKGITPAIYNGTKEHPGLASVVTVRGGAAVNMNTAGPTVLTALGLSAAEIIEIEQSRRNSGPYANVPPKFNGRNLTHLTRTFRVEAEGIVDDRVAARLTAIVQKRTDVDPPSVLVLEWSGAR
ncbi:MAG: general secretion pathway protein GspK [Candidatus Rokuibacteriota bacterium]